MAQPKRQQKQLPPQCCGLFFFFLPRFVSSRSRTCAHVNFARPKRKRRRARARCSSPPRGRRWDFARARAGARDGNRGDSRASSGSLAYHLASWLHCTHPPRVSSSGPTTVARSGRAVEREREMDWVGSGRGRGGWVAETAI